jgi:hypothetical protein
VVSLARVPWWSVTSRQGQHYLRSDRSQTGAGSASGPPRVSWTTEQEQGWWSGRYASGSGPGSCFDANADRSSQTKCARWLYARSASSGRVHGSRTEMEQPTTKWKRPKCEMRTWTGPGRRRVGLLSLCWTRTGASMRGDRRRGRMGRPTWSRTCPCLHATTKSREERVGQFARWRTCHTLEVAGRRAEGWASGRQCDRAIGAHPEPDGGALAVVG